MTKVDCREISSKFNHLIRHLPFTY